VVGSYHHVRSLQGNAYHELLNVFLKQWFQRGEM